MNVSDLLLCLWPGLPKLWLRGHFASLIPALLFAMTLNLALITTFLWTDWRTMASPSFLWPMVVLFWAAGIYFGFRQLPEKLTIPQDVQPAAGETDFLAAAQLAYLQGHFEEAEILAKRQLLRHPDDVPAGLFLGTLYRHQGQWLAARRQLSGLSRWDASVRWRFEIDRELDLIEEELDSQPELESAPELESEQEQDNRNVA